MYAFWDNGKIVGYYSLLLQNNNECELNNLCVLPTYRHRKIGQELLFHALNTAKKSDCVKVNIGIVEENKKLRNWYESFGFIHTGTIKYDFSLLPVDIWRRNYNIFQFIVVIYSQHANKCCEFFMPKASSSAYHIQTQQRLNLSVCKPSYTVMLSGNDLSC